MVLVNEEFWCCFNPLDRGNLYQINIVHFFFTKEIKMKTFQSPRSGKFVSDALINDQYWCFAPCFNPLDRGNLYQIRPRRQKLPLWRLVLFQSPRSGKFVSDSPKNACKLTMSFKRTTLCRHYITNGKMFENVAKKIFQIRTLLLIYSLR